MNVPMHNNPSRDVVEKATAQGNHGFTLQMTNAAKGVALLLLLWHHLFFQSPEYGTLISASARIARLCVPMFLLLSGYGLYESTRHQKRLNVPSFFAKRFVKLYFNYWLIAVLFIPAGVFIFGLTFAVAYGDHATIKFAINMAGLQCYLFGYGYNPTWWFVGLIALLYLLFPLLRFAVRNLGVGFLVISSLFTGLHLPFRNEALTDLLHWQLSFAVGIYLAHINGIVHVSGFFGRLRTWRWVFLFVVLIALAFLSRHSFLNRGFNHCIAGWLAVQLTFGVARCVAKVQDVLAFLGEHSFNIFLFHTFIYYYFFSEQLYAFRNPVLIFCVLTLVCLAISVLIERLKEITRFETLEATSISLLSRTQIVGPQA